MATLTNVRDELSTRQNEYVKQNGIWKIRSLHYYTSFATPYEKGWAKEVMPTRREVARGFEPDKPPSVQYEAFPKYFVPPFHFSHPVRTQSVSSSVVPEMMKNPSHKISRPRQLYTGSVQRKFVDIENRPEAPIRFTFSKAKL